MRVPFVKPSERTLIHFHLGAEVVYCDGNSHKSTCVYKEGRIVSLYFNEKGGPSVRVEFQGSHNGKKKRWTYKWTDPFLLLQQEIKDLGCSRRFAFYLNNIGLNGK